MISSPQTQKSFMVLALAFLALGVHHAASTWSSDKKETSLLAEMTLERLDTLPEVRRFEWTEPSQQVEGVGPDERVVAFMTYGDGTRRVRVRDQDGRFRCVQLPKEKP